MISLGNTSENTHFQWYADDMQTFISKNRLNYQVHKSSGMSSRHVYMHKFTFTFDSYSTLQYLQQYNF